MSFLSCFLQAFEICKAGENFNLSFESLSSHEAIILLCDTQKSDASLWTKISSSQYITKDEIEIVPDADDDHSNCVEDNIDVPIDIVLEYITSGGNVVPEGYAVGLDGGLKAPNNAEDCDSELVDEGAKLVEYGHGTWRAVRNHQYAKFWCH
jgi:hypothetical protein